MLNAEVEEREEERERKGGLQVYNQLGHKN